MSDTHFRFCVPLAATRLLDDADIRLFKAVHKAGSKVPIVFVGTMTDKFLDEWETKVKRRLGMTATDAIIKAELENVYLARRNKIIGETESVLLENRLPALDARAYVAKGKKTWLEQKVARANAEQTMQIQSKTYCDRR